MFEPFHIFRQHEQQQRPISFYSNYIFKEGETCWSVPGMSHAKAVVVVPSRGVMVPPETLMKTKVCLGDVIP